MLLYLIILGLAITLIKIFPKYWELKNNFASQLAIYKQTELNKQMEEYNETVKTEIDKRMQDNAEAATQQALEMVAQWKVEYEEATRRDAINKSHSVNMGKMTEHLIPYFPSFQYDPKDARFLGSPVDLIVFDGLSEGQLRQIIFIEIKTNKSQLSQREKQIRDIINNGLVKWEEIRHMISEDVKP